MTTKSELRNIFHKLRFDSTDNLESLDLWLEICNTYPESRPEDIIDTIMDIEGATDYVLIDFDRNGNFIFRDESVSKKNPNKPRKIYDDTIKLNWDEVLDFDANIGA